MSKITEELISKELIVFVKNNIIDEAVDFSQGTPLKQIGVDSFSVIELVLFLERKFNIQIREEDMLPENFESIATLSQCALKYVI